MTFPTVFWKCHRAVSYRAEFNLYWNFTDIQIEDASRVIYSIYKWNQIAYRSR